MEFWIQFDTKKPLKWRLAFLENSYVGTSDRPFKYMEVHIQQNGRWPLYGKKIYTKRWEMNKWTKRNNTSKKVPGVMFKVRSTKLFVVKTTQFGGNKIHFTKFPPAGRQLLLLGINRFRVVAVSIHHLCARLSFWRAGVGNFPPFQSAAASRRWKSARSNSSGLRVGNPNFSGLERS